MDRPSGPSFLSFYLALPAVRLSFLKQVPEPWLSMYHDRRYDQGYDVLREARIARMQALGIIPPWFVPSTGMPETMTQSPASANWNTPAAKYISAIHDLDDGYVDYRAGVVTKNWASLTDLEKKAQARYMEIYAGIVCSNAPICGKNIALESDGRVYSCDHFVYPEHELGRVGERPLAEMVFSLKQLEFGLHKFNALPSECRTCAYLKLCWGECPRTRILKSRDGEGPLSYLCSGWKTFFRQRIAGNAKPPSGA